MMKNYANQALEKFIELCIQIKKSAQALAQKISDYFNNPEPDNVQAPQAEAARIQEEENNKELARAQERKLNLANANSKLLSSAVLILMFAMVYSLVNPIIQSPYNLVGFLADTTIFWVSTAVSLSIVNLVSKQITDLAQTLRTALLIGTLSENLALWYIQLPKISLSSMYNKDRTFKSISDTTIKNAEYLACNFDKVAINQIRDFTQSLPSVTVQETEAFINEYAPKAASVKNKAYDMLPSLQSMKNKAYNMLPSFTVFSGPTPQPATRRRATPAFN